MGQSVFLEKCIKNSTKCSHNRDLCANLTTLDQTKRFDADKGLHHKYFSYDLKSHAKTTSARGAGVAQPAAGEKKHHSHKHGSHHASKHHKPHH